MVLPNIAVVVPSVVVVVLPSSSVLMNADVAVFAVVVTCPVVLPSISVVAKIVVKSLRLFITF